ncbi:cytochrome c-type protein NapC [Affinibrenneria salicis]|uniref:Cytochrome c-type protein n=1 Tax=Affinibrenneria salicis TaxID=2590031 RepID=A0A5J5FVU6_9GAMM|nr:NapC/NirT family cytochrome c [Affinibrenneria salicis]KAA8997760.1 cytochrome c-type protein NapC [Affinibrenneria salicis]
MTSSKEKGARTGLMRRLWRRPTRLASGILLLLGFAGGILLIAGFNRALEMTNSEAFCISCHEMRDNVYEEYLDSAHYSNRSGVSATCADCHVPHELAPMMVRKVQASKELYGKMTGLIDTPEKFEQHRLAMAQSEWRRMKANDSQECRNCHKMESMDFTAQKTLAAQTHSQAIDEGKTCIDCHKGIAHKLPEMQSAEGATR